MIRNEKISIGRMTQLELDAFRNTVRSLLAHPCSSSLSSIVGDSFDYRIKKIALVKPELLNGIGEEHPHEVCGVFLKSEGDFRAAMLLYLGDDQAKTLAACLLGRDNLDTLDDLAKSSISEIGNVLFVGSFLNAIYRSSELKTMASVPGLGQGDLRALIESPIAEIGMESEEMVMAESELRGINSGIRLRMLLVLSENDARRIMTTMDEAGSPP